MVVGRKSEPFSPHSPTYLKHRSVCELYFFVWKCCFFFKQQLLKKLPLKRYRIDTIDTINTIDTIDTIDTTIE